MKQNFDIDFVVPWVDGSDPEWIKEFNKYAPKENRKQIDASAERYRDYGLLKYWFRGVEKFAPWVRKVHFITCGQKPEWLNLSNPKLHWVKHEDYIPKEYLPVFSSHPIELYMHHIPDLAEHFVYFNDDFFLTAPVKPEFFFKNGLPCDSAVENVVLPNGIEHILLNDIEQINSNFKKRSVIKGNISKWFNLKYGSNMLRNLFLLPWPAFSGFRVFHLAQPYTKSLLEEVWCNCEGALKSTMNNRFRSITDVNQYLFRYWQLCSGCFYPVNLQYDRKFLTLNKDMEIIIKALTNKKCKEVVLNDALCDNFETKMESIVSQFQKILPQKSCFEI